MKLTVEQRKLFKDIFIGIPDPKSEYGAYIVKPHWEYLKYYNNTIDNYEVAVKTFYDLVKRGEPFNYTFFQMVWRNNTKREFTKYTRQKNAEMRAYKHEHISMNTSSNTGMPKYEWKEKLTKDELMMVRLLKEGLTQRQIYTQYKIHPSKQTKLRNSLKNKIII